VNIVVNAAHAIADVARDRGEKGTITVSTRAAGAWAEIRIADTGTGIPPEIRQKIFDPFFTTKGVGRGTGQGLAIAHSVVVDKHGGVIEVESEMGRGTTFLLRLPICAAASEGRTA
jgi:signal transduction histidine kinase